MARRPPSDLDSPGPRPYHVEIPSRRTSSESADPNVFSDEYAVDSGDSIRGLTPTESVASQSDHSSTARDYTPARVSFDANWRLSNSQRPPTVDPSASPRHSTSLSVSSPSFDDTRRALSVSSRSSLPRAASPYRGPTAPSQPYAMYPQITRASSITSESTIRPVERPFVPQGGPEHPYAMYQNTVPEEADVADAPLDVGFLGLSQPPYPSTNSSSGDDVGDIVGSDGHVEALPPYSRYADNVIAKGDMARLDAQGASIADDSTLVAGTPAPASSGSDMELTAAGNDTASMDAAARKEGWLARKRRETCCGVPLWTLVLVIVVVVLAAVLGGVIGGVVGDKKGVDRGLASAATTTVWLDADPAETGPSTPACPTGHYSLHINQTQQMNSCILDGNMYMDTWSCLDFAMLGINVFESPSGGPPLSVVFDDYSLRPQLFRYGAQPPDFNGTAFTMSPYKDKENDSLGVALFFSVLFDKLNILPADALSVGDVDKRSVSPAQLSQRDEQWTNTYLSVGDKPWYCFWNSTINEFWIFLEQDLLDDDGDGDNGDNYDGSAATSSTATITSGYSHPTGFGGSQPTATSPMHPTGPTPVNSAATTAPTSAPTGGSYWPGGQRKRQASNVGAPAPFPKLVKMVEKRKPQDNVQPYCQQMQVLNNWQIMPIPNIPTIQIGENEYVQSEPTGSKRFVRRSPDTIQQLGSNCFCEWFGTD